MSRKGRGYEIVVTVIRIGMVGGKRFPSVFHLNFDFNDRWYLGYGKTRQDIKGEF